MTSVTVRKLLFWLEKKYNILLEGRHGIGKTSMIVEALNQSGLRWAYFSASTMDPFVDFVGIPVKVDVDLGKNGKPISVIELIRPRQIVEGDFQVIFLDELNRSHKKIRNALMEIIQFKTINGKPFSSDLRCVWGAINPENDGQLKYDVEPLDPTQKDRFFIQVKMPYQCDTDYFIKKYGSSEGKAAVQFWNELPEDVKLLVSPRRIDYAVQAFKENADVRDVLPECANPGKLVSVLASGPADEKLRSLMSSKEESRKYLCLENNYSYAIATILISDEYRRFFLPLMPAEKISMLFSTEANIKKMILDDIKVNMHESAYFSILKEIAEADQNAEQASIIRKELKKFNIPIIPSHVEVIYNDKIDCEKAEDLLDELRQRSKPQTFHRKQAYSILLTLIPKKMTNSAAKKILSICNQFCVSWVSTVSKEMPKVIAISNHAFVCMLKNGMTEKEVSHELTIQGKLKTYRMSQNAHNINDLDQYVKRFK